MTLNCSYCGKRVSKHSKSIECYFCSCSFHLKCSNLTKDQYNRFCPKSDCWLCPPCRNFIFPFNTLSQNVLLKLCFNSNTACKCSKKLTKTILKNMRSYEVISSLSNIANLDHFDIESHVSHNINFDYFDVHDFHNNSELTSLKNSLSFLHCNVRSLQANYDKLIDLLACLNFEFSIIGLSEIKFQIGKENCMNTAMKDYSFISQSSATAAGGVGFYINNKLNFSERDDLSKSTDQFESSWIELKDSRGKTFLCAVFYRHPSGDMRLFFNDYFETIDKVTKENKKCVIMGDFNIDLLKYESHQLTEEFINTMNTFSFSPMITKPTRITDHSATLIDHIFSNSLDYYTISGNIIFDITDHLSNFLLIDNTFFHSKTNKVFKRDYSNYNKSALVEDFCKIDWRENLQDINSVDDMYETFFAKTNDIVN